MDTRARILERDGHLCRCEQCQRSSVPLPATEVDHVVPLCDGGPDADGNLQALNSDCHKRKSAAEAEQRAQSKFSTPEAAGDPLKFLLGVMNDPEQDARLRVRAAVAAAQYVHTKTHDGGKKEERSRAAEQAASGKFGAGQPPLRMVSGGRQSGAT